MTNPLLAEYASPFETAPFHLIKNEHYLPAVKAAISVAKADIEKIKAAYNKQTFNPSMMV